MFYVVHNGAHHDKAEKYIAIWQKKIQTVKSALTAYPLIKRPFLKFPKLASLIHGKNDLYFAITSLQVPLCLFLLSFTVPTFVTAHTFCASRDTRVSYGWCLLIQEYFCAV